ncbi:MAG: hypothetical protein KFF77_03295 [Bacteroidetes bacterium]|nr:hypothetical protein [Bacteroidota bacterium]
MKRLSVLFVLLLLPVVAISQQVTFSVKAPDVGMTRSAVDTMALVALISVNAEGTDQVLDMEQGERKVFTETVLETEGNVVTRKRITVTEAVARSMQPMQPVTVKSAPVTGKTYIIERRDDSVAVTSEDGADVTKEERTYMMKEFGGKSEAQFNRILEGRTMRVGEELELKDEMLKEFGAGMTDGGLSVRGAKLRLQRLGERDGVKTAVFDVDITFGGAQGIMEMEIALNGTAEVGVENLWPFELVMNGTLAGAGSHAGASLTADGEMQMARIATYK